MVHCTTSRRLFGKARKKDPAMFVTVILSKIRNYLRYRDTVRELSQLTDRELSDLGISRFQIDSIARSHAAA
jgi:uncharacterized protein YjiS (DUF1127 family)